MIQEKLLSFIAVVWKIFRFWESFYDLFKELYVRWEAVINMNPDGNSPTA